MQRRARRVARRQVRVAPPSAREEVLHRAGKRTPRAAAWRRESRRIGMAGWRSWWSSADGVLLCGGSPLRARRQRRRASWPAGSGRGGEGVGVGQDEAAGALGAAQHDGLPQERPTG
jgi:hypothetical protein